MKPAKRLDKIGMWFKGPCSAPLFKLLYIEPPDFEAVSIGTGESRAIAAVRAIAHLKGKGFGPVMKQINDEVQFILSDASHIVEGDEQCAVYCILGVSAER